MRKNGLLALTSILFIFALGVAFMDFGPNENVDRVGPTQITTQISNDLMFYNRWQDFKIVDDQIHYGGGGGYESGSIYLSDNLVRIKRTQNELTFFVDKKGYDEDEQIHIFYSGDDKVELDVTMKRLILTRADSTGTIYYINSTIKSNW